MDFSTTYQSSTLNSWYQKRPTLSNAMQYRERTVLREAGKRNNAVQTIPFVNANRDDDARSCPDTAVHASDASQSLSHPVKNILASRTCFSDKTEKVQQEKNRQNTRKTTKKYTRQDIPLDRKVMVFMSTSRVELHALLRRSRLSLLPANPQSSKPLASTGLCF